MKNILFVCIENSCRSQMAEAFAHIHSNGIIKAYSSGSRPSGKVNERAIEYMKEVNYDLSTHSSISLNEIPDIEYEYAITMGCGDECPMVKAKHHVDWGIDDPKHLDADGFRHVRDLIEQKVKTLADTLEKETGITGDKINSPSANTITKR